MHPFPVRGRRRSIGRAAVVLFILDIYSSLYIYIYIYTVGGVELYGSYVALLFPRPFSILRYSTEHRSKEEGDMMYNTVMNKEEKYKTRGIRNILVEFWLACVRTGLCGRRSKWLKYLLL